MITAVKSCLMYPYRFGRNADILHIDTVRKGFNTYRRDVGWNRHLFQSLTPCKSIISHVTQSLSQNHRIQITASPEGIRIYTFHRLGNHHQLYILIVLKCPPAYNLHRFRKRHIGIRPTIFNQSSSTHLKIGRICRICLPHRKLTNYQCQQNHQHSRKAQFSH